MSTTIIYLLKLSVSLGVVFLFYQLVLRRLTFYNWNRWYLLGYSLLSFVIPFIDITPALHKNELNNATLVQWVPMLYNQTGTAPILNIWNLLSLIIFAGMMLMLIRLIIQLISFRRMMRKATLISEDAVNLYQVNESIIPFSFGKGIFINRHLHTEKELEEIIRHEFVHVKQHHSIDIIFSEILCMLNWYNPFAWMLKAAIRQNLEFVADNQLLENGIDKKQYQYLLLKVIGDNHFSIAQKFNFSSLKKRIAMMNKKKSVKMHLLRFLFILPLLAVILISFRQGKETQPAAEQPHEIVILPVADTIPEVTTPNNKGYIINIKDKKGECLVVVKDKKGKEVDRLLLTKWNEKKEYYDELYGEIPPPPPPPVPVSPAVPPIPPTAPVKGKVAVVSNEGIDQLAALCEDFEISNKKATMYLKNGETEEYDLTNIDERRKFEKKYGRIIDLSQKNADGLTPVAIVNHGSGQTVLAPMTPLAATGTTVLALDPTGNLITGEEDILIVITKSTSRQQLDDFKKQMKAKDIELTYDEIEYDEKGVLVSISGKMKSKDGHSNFSAFDFTKLTLAMVKYNGRTYFKVSTGEKKVLT